MSVDSPAEEQALKEQVERSEHALRTLERDLQAIDSELEQCAQQNPKYELLREVCQSLEELDDLGAAHLFWGQQSGLSDTDEQLRHARDKIDQFTRQVAGIEERRHALAEKIGDRNQNLDVLHYDLNDAMEREESRKNEWLLEREPEPVPYRANVMPWARGYEEDDRFRRSLAASVLLCLSLGLLFSVIDLPILDRASDIEVPERIARLVREELPPPPAVAEPVIEELEIPDPEEPELAEDEPIEELPEQPMVAEAEQPDTREQVKSKGILAFRESFASRAHIQLTAQLGSQATLSNAGENSVGRPERSMVTTSAPGSSGGINLASISRNVGGGGGGIDGVELSRVASSIGGGDGPNRPLSGGLASGRTDEEIQIVFDRYKSALYRLYNRELRKDPTLRGQLVLRLTIEPDGSVSLCQVQSSDMGAPVLANQVVTRVRGFDFGAKDGIVAVTIVYPIDFLPAA